MVLQQTFTFATPKENLVDHMPFWLLDKFPKLYEHAAVPFMLDDTCKFKSEIAWHSNFRTVYPHTTRFRLLKAITETDFKEIEKVLGEWKRQGVSINTTISKKYGMNALQYAAFTNRHSVIEYLLLRGADINYQDEQTKSTSLMFAVDGSSKECVHTLVKNGCDIQVRDKYGYTARERAEFHYNMPIEEYLGRQKPRGRIFPAFTVKLGIQDAFEDEGWKFISSFKVFRKKAAFMPFNDLKGTYRVNLTAFKTLGELKQQRGESVLQPQK